MPGDVGFRVATAYVALGVDDSTIEDQIVEAVSTACSAAGSVGGDVLIQQLVEAASRGGDEIAGGLIESVSGAGDAMGADIGDSLTAAVAKAGSVAGDEIGQGILEGAAGTGDTLAGQLGKELTSGAESAGAEAGEGLAEAIEGPVSLLGSQVSQLLSTGLRAGLAEVDADVSALMEQLPATVDPHATYAGLRIGSALAAGIAGMGAVVAAAIGAGLTAGAVDAASEAGTAAGGALAAGIADGLGGSLSRTGSEAAEEVESSLADALAQAGSAAGASLAAGIADGAGGDADDVAMKISEAMQASLETTMVDAGKAAGDSFGSGLVEGVGDVADDVATDIADALKAPIQSAMSEVAIIAGDAFAQSLEVTAPTAAAGAGVVAQEAMAELKEESVAGAEEAATAAGEAYVFQYGATVKLNWANVAASRASFDTPQQPEQEWVSQIDAMNLTSVAEAQAAAARAAAQAATDALVGTIEADQEVLQEGVENFLELSDAGLRTWMAEVETAAAASTSAFIDTYAAIDAQLDATTALTEQQAEAVEYLYASASSEMQALHAEAAALNESMATSAGSGFGQGGDLIAANLGSTGRELGAVSEAADGTAEAAGRATGAFGGMGAMMSGPAMIGMMGLTMVLPLVGDLFDSSAVSAAAFTSAVSQDSGAVGDNTAATIQQTLAKSNLSDISKTLGLSQSQLIEYAAGEASVQAQVAAAYDKTTASMAQQAQGTAQGGPESGREAGYDLNKLQEQKAALDAVTSAVQQAVQEDAANSAALLTAEQSTAIYNASVHALGESQLLQVQQTKMSNQATVEYRSQLLAAESSASYMNAAIGAGVVNLKLQGLAADVSAQALNASLQPQERLSQAAITASLAYAQASTATGAYTTSLNALYGQYGTTTAAEAAFTTDLAGLSGTVTHGKDAVDQYTKSGAANVTAFQQVASQAIATAGDIYQTTHSTTDANTALQHMATELDTAASHAGLTKIQIAQLNTELFGVPTVKQISITANTSQAMAAIASLNQALGAALSTENNVAAGTGAASQHAHQLDHYAAGGIAQAGKPAVFGEEGPEIGIPTSDMRIIPARQTAQLLSGASSGGAASTFNFYGTQYPTGEQMAIMKRELASSIGAV